MAKGRMKALQRRYGKKKGRSAYQALERPRAYQVMVKEGSAAPRPLRGMRLFDSKREAASALRTLAPYQDENTRMALRTVRR